jgi:hypothetical protein
MRFNTEPANYTDSYTTVSKQKTRYGSRNVKFVAENKITTLRQLWIGPYAIHNKAVYYELFPFT